VDRLSAGALHRRVWSLVAAREADVEDAALARLGSELASGGASIRLEDVAATAARRQVRLLLYAEGARLWGRVDRTSGRCELRPAQADAEDAEVIDDLIEMTILAGGDVLEVHPARLPPGVAVAAIHGQRDALLSPGAARVAEEPAAAPSGEES